MQANLLPPGCSSAFSQQQLNSMCEIFITYRTNLRETSISSQRSGDQTGRALSLSSGTSLSVPSNLLRGVPLFLKLLIVSNSDAFFSNSHVELHGENASFWMGFQGRSVPLTFSSAHSLDKNAFAPSCLPSRFCCSWQHVPFLIIAFHLFCTPP